MIVLAGYLPLAAVFMIMFPLMPSPLWADEGRGAIIVEITGFRNEEGRAGVLLFAGEKGFPDDPGPSEAKAFAPIDHKRSRVVLEDVPYGTYAVSVFHDEDGDGKPLKSIFGIPLEGVGASRNPSMRFGPPGFNESSFTLDTPERVVNVTIRYLKGQKGRGR